MQSKEVPFLFLIGKVLTNKDNKERTFKFTVSFPFLIGKVLTTAFKPL